MERSQAEAVPQFCPMLRGRRSVGRTAGYVLGLLIATIQLAGCASLPDSRNLPVAEAQPLECRLPAEARVLAASAEDFIWPVPGEVLDRFGARPDGRRMDGIAIATSDCAPVRAAASGQVVYAGSDIQGLGYLVLVHHDGGFLTVYAHNRELLVTQGETVAQGQPIAFAGQAPVQFQLRVGKEPVDPLAYLGTGTIHVASAAHVLGDMGTAP